MFVELAARAETVQLSGLDRRRRWPRWSPTWRAPRPPTRWAAEVHRRTDGHPFFARQLTELLVGAGPAAAVPGAVRDVVARRVRAALRRVPCAGGGGRGGGQRPAARRAGRGRGPRRGHRHPAHGGGRAGRGAGPRRRRHPARRPRPLPRDGRGRAAVPRRLRLHQQIADALEHRRARGAAVAAADLARHTRRGRAAGGQRAGRGLGPSRGPRRLRPPGLRGGGRRTSPGPGAPSRTAGRRTRPGCSSTCSSRRPTPAPERATPARRGRCSTTPAAARPPAGMPSGSPGSRWGCSGSAPGSRCPVTPSSRSWRPRSSGCSGRGTRWRPTWPRASRASCTTRYPRNGRGPGRSRSRRSPSPAPSTTPPRSRRACSPATTSSGRRAGRGSGSRSPGRSASWPRAPATPSGTPKDCCSPPTPCSSRVPRPSAPC